MRVIGTLVAFLSLLLIIPPALAQDAGLTVSLRRTWGYSDGTGKIRGLFEVEVTGPSNLVEVIILLDDQPMATLSAPPFKHAFQTEDHTNGTHTLRATGRTADGLTTASPVRQLTFVSAEEEAEAVRTILVPLFSIAAIVIVLSALVPLALTFRGQRSNLPLGAPRQYGWLGGTVCPKCDRPFSIHWWSPRFVIVRFDRCDHCGQWSLVRRQSPEVLRAAEQREVETSQRSASAVAELSPEAKLKQQLDDSRFSDNA